MKTITLLLLIFAITETQAQNYLITFAGKGGSTVVDSVKVENLTQCKDTSLAGSNTLHLTAGTVGINETDQNENGSLRIYPSPMTENCMIEFKATASANATIELYDITGKRIIVEQIILTKEIHRFKLSGINSGVYFLKITLDIYSYTAKIVSTKEQKGTARISYQGRSANNENEIYASNTVNINKTRSERAITDMQYTTGDRLKLTGYAGGKYRTIIMLVPTNSQIDTFNFVNCVDADSNHYAVVQIGTQIWMAENLRTTKYNTGVSIGTTTPATLNISGETTPKYQWAYDGNESNVDIFGRLYTWYAATDSRNIVPVGWRLPSNTEWTTLTTYLSGEPVAGIKLKENCSNLWSSPNIGATNESGFSGRPGGYRDFNGNYVYVGYYGYWWSATEYNSLYAWYRYVDVDFSYMAKDNYYKYYGYSVRCLKD
jgi:uncharacterized protein (TIGR02145 family)